MIELRWLTTEHAPPTLQYRRLVAVDARGAFSHGLPFDWVDVPLVPSHQEGVEAVEESEVPESFSAAYFPGGGVI
jgi:hypothetical protein